MRKMAVPPLASGTLARRTTAARARRRRTRRPAGSAAARAAPTPQRGCCGCGSATENRANWCNPATTLSSPRASRPRSAWTWRACDTPVVQGRPRWDTIFRRTTFWCRPLARRSCQTSKLPSLAARRKSSLPLLSSSRRSRQETGAGPWTRRSRRRPCWTRTRTGPDFSSWQSASTSLAFSSTASTSRSSPSWKKSRAFTRESSRCSASAGRITCARKI
mmetsp:Transcript_7394/g.26376  ORF Transcript_7394/g.26376 Transcript_7394/m.26376 type:complete len:219 (-) Transcript_7394:1975-2631(-)